MKTPKPVGLSRGLRRRQTDAEEKLWLHLRNRQVDGKKFRWQQAVGKYIVDFVCFECKLIVEIDGGQHNESPQIEKDEFRSKYLENCGYMVLRFWNNDVLENIEGVFVKIKDTLNIRLHSNL